MLLLQRGQRRRTRTTYRNSTPHPNIADPQTLGNRGRSESIPRNRNGKTPNTQTPSVLAHAARSCMCCKRPASYGVGSVAPSSVIWREDGDVGSVAPLLPGVRRPPQRRGLRAAQRLILGSISALVKRALCPASGGGRLEQTGSREWAELKWTERARIRAGFGFAMSVT